MNVLFSRAEEINGGFRAAGGEISGFAQVLRLPLVHGHRETTVSFAGPITVQRLLGMEALREGTDIAVVSVADIVLELPDPVAVPAHIAVSGLARVVQDPPEQATLEFAGTFHPASYFWEAVASLRDGQWHGQLLF